MKAKYLVLTVAIAVVAVAWDWIDEKSLAAYWWTILSMTLGIGLYDSMLQAKTED